MILRRLVPGPRAAPAASGARTLVAAAALLAAAAAGALPAPAAAQPAEPEGEDGELRLGGGVYLYHFAPLDLTGGDATSEIYALYLDLDRSAGPWTIHVQGRWRDTRLRSFFPSNVWIQEAWVAFEAPLAAERAAASSTGPAAASAASSASGSAPSSATRPGPPTLTVRAGKIYQRLGRFWDGSFIGNVHYFDGLKLDPEFGVEAVARVPLGTAGARLVAHGQLLTHSDRVNGSLPGRDLEGAEAEESAVAAGLRLETPLARAGGDPVQLRLGLSGLAERADLPDEVRAPAGAGAGSPADPADDGPEGDEEAELPHLAADAEVSWRWLRAYAEWTRRGEGAPEAVPDVALGPAGSRASYWLTGLQARLGPLRLRYNYSTGRYDDGGFREHLHQPGVTLRLGEGVEALLEYDDWRRVPTGAPVGAGGPNRELRVDRSLNGVLHLEL